MSSLSIPDDANATRNNFDLFSDQLLAWYEKKKQDDKYSRKSFSSMKEGGQRNSTLALVYRFLDIASNSDIGGLLVYLVSNGVYAPVVSELLGKQRAHSDDELVQARHIMMSSQAKAIADAEEQRCLC
jgi:hypothetical protein